jgi:uncharacterized membrane protein YqaE (UPF0057 family)
MKHQYLLYVIICCLLASCSTARFDEVSSVKYDQKILGKGFGRPQTEVTVNEPAKNNAQPPEEQTIAATQPEQVEMSVAKPVSTKVVAPESKTLTASNSPVVKELSAGERKSLQKQLRRTIIKQSVKSFFGGGDNNSSAGLIAKALLILIAIFIPPLAVALHLGIHKEFWIDLLLTLLLWVPGIIYAIVVIVIK